MRLVAELPLDRSKPGTLRLEDDAGTVLYGPVRCRGKSDNERAAAHDNAVRDPTRPYGDHPAGEYLIGQPVKDKLPAHSYGEWFFPLEPISGDALVAKLNGRVGLAAHSGDLNDDGSLRSTEGCLRVDPETAAALEQHLAPELLAHRSVRYVCVNRMPGG